MPLPVFHWPIDLPVEIEPFSSGVTLFEHQSGRTTSHAQYTKLRHRFRFRVRRHWDHQARSIWRFFVNRQGRRMPFILPDPFMGEVGSDLHSDREIPGAHYVMFSDGNAAVDLGRKFIIPNTEQIYLSGTPQRSATSLSNGDFSSELAGWTTTTTADQSIESATENTRQGIYSTRFDVQNTDSTEAVLSQAVSGLTASSVYRLSAEVFIEPNSPPASVTLELANSTGATATSTLASLSKAGRWQYISTYVVLALDTTGDVEVRVNNLGNTKKAVVFVDRVALEKIQYQIEPFTGSVTFNSAPVTSQGISAVYEWGRKVRLAQDVVDFDNFTGALFETGIEVEEVF